MTNLIDEPNQVKRIQGLEADLRTWQKTVEDPLV